MSHDLSTREGRLTAVNELIQTIASCGRKFFSDGGKVARLEMDERGRLWFHDSYTGARIYTHYRGTWRGFTGGGTLRRLVQAMCRFVARGERIPSGMFGPWPEWMCPDLWGYGDDILLVRWTALELGVVVDNIVPVCDT